MRSNRRIAFYLLGTMVFLGGYSAYAAFLGSLDGLPPLPPELLREPDPNEPLPAPPPNSPIDEKFRDAFGRNCPETDYTIKIEVRAKGMVLGAGEFVIEPDGRVQLAPFSLAIFGRSRSGMAEVNTLHCDRAFLTFDKPVKNLAEMGSRKIIEAELISDETLGYDDDRRRGSIHVTNNRKTADIADDIRLVTPGPIHYTDDPRRGLEPGAPLPPHIWTANAVAMFDYQNSPFPVTESTLRMPETKPNDLRQPGALDDLRAGKRGLLPTATATGLRLFLALEPTSSPTPTSLPKKAPGTITGVEKIELTTNVQMNLWVDSRSNFFNGAAPPKELPKPSPKAAPVPEKSLIQIETAGRFDYDVVRDRARFDNATRSDPSLPNHVLVTRHVKPHIHDLLACDSLEMQFRRQKSEAKPKPDAGAQENLQIESVHAWGKTVAVSSNSDQIQAWGSDLVYDALAKQTTFTGDKLVVLKDGNLIEAYQLIMAGMDNKDSQQARIKGPGRIGMGMRDEKTETYPRQAHWKDWLIYGKSKEKEQVIDMLTLTGGAMFVDTLNGQSLAARELKVWLVEAPKKAGQVGGDGRKPQRLEATGSVVAHSADLEVERADHLNVWFKDVPPKPKVATPPPVAGPPPPAIVTLPTELAPVTATPTKREPMPIAVVAEEKREPAPAPKKKADPAKKPIRLAAKQIETWVRRDGERSELERAHCDGKVVVLQDPTDAGQKGVDIVGNTLVLDRYPEGNVMVVHGTLAERAKVVFDKLALVGPEVSIDQRNNLATVKGAGTMKLKSSTDLEGKKLKKESDIDIAWTDNMEFRGAEKWARFEGGVQATQVSSRVLCQTMQVTLDREVWLNQDQKPKDPSKGNESPKVEFVVCDHAAPDGRRADLDLPEQVVFVDSARDAAGKLIKVHRVEAPELDLDNPRGQMIAPGPGVVRMFQPGAKNAAGPADPKKPQETEMKLTIVTYKGRMKAVKSREGDRRMATFLEDIEVLHAPAAGPRVEIDRVNLGEGGMHLKCDESMDVYTTNTPDGKTNQEMIARGNAIVRTVRDGQDFTGKSEVVKFDEAKDLITFEGSKETPATLYRVKVKGQRPEVFRGERILYYRGTNNFEVINGSGGSTN